MDPKVHGGFGLLEARELEQRGANAGERRDVKPYRAPGGALKGPKHRLPESNGRAGCCSRYGIGGLKRPAAPAAVSGEG